MLLKSGRLPTFDHGSVKYDVPRTWKLKPSSRTNPSTSMIAKNRAGGVRRLDQRNHARIARHGTPKYAPFSESFPRKCAAIESVQCQPTHVSRVGTTRLTRSAGYDTGEFTPSGWKCRKK